MENLNELFKALSLAQGSISAAHKSKENPAFKREGKASTYADIADVIEVIQKPASENGLNVFFNYKSVQDGTFIQYLLSHTSGQCFVSEWLFMFMRDDTCHGFGASNTFMRRQLLKAIYQIPEDDDDGNAASKKENNKDPQKLQDNPLSKLITEPQGQRLFAIMKTCDWTMEQAQIYMKTMYEISKFKDLDQETYAALICVMQSGNYASAMKGMME